MPLPPKKTQLPKGGSEVELEKDPRFSSTIDSLKRRVRVIVNELDNVEAVLGTSFEVDILAERVFLVCHTFIDERFSDRIQNISHILRQQYKIQPTYVKGKQPYYRWLLFS